VDTPGFDDTFVSDGEILRKLSEWLTTSYREGKKVSAILYVHRISDPRMQGSALRNFRVFRDLCGEEFFERVDICTTFWDLYQEDQSVPKAKWKSSSLSNFGEV